MKKTGSYIIALFVIVSSMASCGQKETSQEEAPFVDVTAVKGVGEVDATTFTGKTKSASEVNLAFRVAGQIERVLVKEGDFVRQGQLSGAIGRHSSRV